MTGLRCMWHVNMIISLARQMGFAQTRLFELSFHPMNDVACSKVVRSWLVVAKTGEVEAAGCCFAQLGSRQPRVVQRAGACRQNV